MKMNSQEIDTVWKPHVTVAAVVENKGRFLMVEEETELGTVFNQPAGHLEKDEDLVSAMLRETLEETAWEVEPESLIAVYRWPHPHLDITYLRFAFAARPIRHHPERALDEGIIATHWLDLDALRANRERHRGPQVWQCIDDYLHGEHMPLSCLKELHYPDSSNG
ncbi:MAG: NUDIX hydrolase [Acidiferrobacterales bacterium]